MDFRYPTIGMPYLRRCAKFFLVSIMSILLCACQSPPSARGTFQYHFYQSYWDMDEPSKATIDGYPAYNYNPSDVPNPAYSTHTMITPIAQPQPVPTRLPTASSPILATKLTLVDPLHKLTRLFVTTKIKVAVILPQRQSQRPEAMALLRDGFLEAFWQAPKQFRQKVVIQVYEDRGIAHENVNRALKKKGITYVLRLTLDHHVKTSECRRMGQQAFVLAVKEIKI